MMQLKHPEILWGLFLLVIPIIVHLFQLRRFKKTPFTNVAMLQKIMIDSQRANQLKKWLLLFTRLLLLASLIIAFAQPFTAKNQSEKEKETVIYLDNSFSMQARENGITLLEQSVQNLIRYADPDRPIHIFTNTNSFSEVTVGEIQNLLLDIPFTHKQLNWSDIVLKAESIFSRAPAKEQELIVISDFKENLGAPEKPEGYAGRIHFVKAGVAAVSNISIDSIQLETPNSSQKTLKVFVSGYGETGVQPLSLQNGNKLLGNSAVEFDEENSRTVVDFSLPNQTEIDGLLKVSDNGLEYDNHFFFSINPPQTINVLAINGGDAKYLERLFSDESFALNIYDLRQLDYSAIDTQNVVVVNEIEQIPEGLQNVLRTFASNGGSLIVVPAKQKENLSYNTFLSLFGSTRFSETVENVKQITKIAFEHPIYRGVFQKQVKNFEYPETNHSFTLSNPTQSILSYEDGTPFLMGGNGFYLFTSPLDENHCNFKSSPLIVPTFYNMALSSLRVPVLYETIGNASFADIDTRLDNDQVVNMTKDGESFIPRQQSFPNKVRLFFDAEPQEAGTYFAKAMDSIVSNVSFNYPRTESQPSELEIREQDGISQQESLNSLFSSLAEENEVSAYWKWFVILALLLGLAEVIIQKIIK